MQTGLNDILLAFGLTLVAGLSTGIGSVIALIAKKTDTRFLSLSLGLSAGVMIYVSFMELMPESVALLSGIYGGKLPSLFMLLAFFAGIGLIALIDAHGPPEGYPLSTVDEKKRMLHEKHIALWDAVSSCSLSGSADSSIKDVIANDIASLIGKTEIRKVLANGSLAARIYQKLIFPQSGIGCIPLPSTSPANAAFSLERLCEIWSQELLH